MNIPQIIEQATITNNEKIAPDIFHMKLDAPAVTQMASPGQFVMVGLLSGLDPLLRRPLSIHNIIGEQLSLLYKVVGKGTAAMAALETGKQLSLLGPLGRGFQPTGHHHCLVGGGLGIAPLLFLANNIKEKYQPQSMTILLGGRNEQELLAKEDFARAGEVQLATDDGSIGRHGFVSELLTEMSNPEMQVYTCGPSPMMKVIAQICRQKDWSCQVSLESHMACGIGACLGCAVEKAQLQADQKKYVHVCKDGPVFNAGDIWL